MACIYGQISGCLSREKERREGLPFLIPLTNERDIPPGGWAEMTLTIETRNLREDLEKSYHFSNCLVK